MVKPFKEWDLSLIDKQSEPAKSELKKVVAALEEQLRLDIDRYYEWPVEGSELYPKSESYAVFDQICKTNGLDNVMALKISENGKFTHFDVPLSEII